MYNPSSEEYPYSATRPEPAVTLPLPSLCLIDFEQSVVRSEPGFEGNMKVEKAGLKGLEGEGIRVLQPSC